MRVQFISPHPDDVELYCGGALLHHHAAGDSIQVLGMTRGESGCLRLLRPFCRDAVRTTRTREMEERVRRLEGAELVWLDFADGRMAEAPDGPSRITHAITSFAPEMIYLPETAGPDSLRRHPDHRVSSRRVTEAASELNHPVVLRYYHTRCPNRWVDISEWYDESMEALRLYRHQYGATAFPPFLLHVLERQRTRWVKACGAEQGVACAESFREVTTAEQADAPP